MRLLITVPDQSEATGNLVTARRLQAGLAEFGLFSELALLPDVDPLPAYRQACKTLCPDAVLLLHAWRTGRAWLRSRDELPLPAAVLLTGTDIHGGLDDSEQGPVIRAVLESADLLLTQNHLTAANLIATWGNKVHHLPPAVQLGTTPYLLREQHQIPADAILFLHPAGIRPIKANFDLLWLCDPLAARHKEFRLAFCGPVLDPVYGAAFLAAVTQRPWASWLGVIPSGAMPAALAAADVVLNHSRSEGLPGALLEALAVGRAILAHDIPGNAAIIDAGGNGLLYSDSSEFLRQAEGLINDPEQRQRLATAPRPDLSPKTEAATLAALLRTLHS
jgi:glycosyltransferase involved in cell wall biosynthesis